MVSTRRGGLVWKSVVVCVLGAAGVALVRASAVGPFEDGPRMDPNCLNYGIVRNGIPGKASPPLPTDDDDSALAGACSCDASSPAGERPPELEDYRTEHDLGDPVHPHNGMVTTRRTDLCLPGRGLAFAFTRSYSSKAATKANVYPLGQGWDHNYNLVLGESTENGATIYELSNGNNRVDTYRQLPGDQVHWRSPGIYSELQFDESEVVLRARHGTKTHFTLPTESVPGRLTKIEDRNGNHLTFDYDGSGRLTKITDPMGREVVLGYFAAGNNKERLIHTVTDPTGRAVTFEYARRFTDDDDSWVLAKATSPLAPVAVDPIDSTFTYGWANGKTEGYRYYNGTELSLAYRLASVVAPREYTGDDSSGWANGTPYVRFTYDESDTWLKGWCVTQILGNPADSTTPTGGTISYAYVVDDQSTVEGNPNVVRLKTTVTDRGGRITDYSFNESGHVLEIDEHDSQISGGHVRTAFSYYYYYEWWTHGGTWGPDGELHVITYPNGSEETREYVDPANEFVPRWSAGNLKSRVFHDGVTSLPDRSITYTWDPVYNHPLTVTDELGSVTSFVYDYMEGSLTAGANCVVPAMASELWMDPNALTTILTSNYSGLLQDADLNGDGKHAVCCGNVIQKIYPDVHLDAQATGAFTAQTWETDDIQQGIYSLTYNTYGQVTSQTDPEQNATVYLYTPESDLDGNSSADGTGFTGTGTLTGGFLKRVVRDVALPYPSSGSPDPQLSTPWTVSTRSLGTDIGRDSTYNPTPKAAITDLVHNLRGNLTSYTDPRGVKTDYWVNELEETWRVAEATSVTPTGRASGWNGSDETTTSDFDALSNIIRRWNYDANGMTIQFQRRNTGNLTDTGSFSGWLEQSYTYDLLNRMRTRIIEYGTAGQTAPWIYGYAVGDDFLDSVQAPEGNVTVYRYTDRGQVKSVIEGSGTAQSGTTVYTYDVDRNLLTTKDPLNHLTQNTYDGFDRLITVTSPILTETRYTYDNASRVTAVVVHGVPAPGGTAVDLTRTEYKYDERSRVYQIDRSDPQSALTDGALTPSDGKVSARIDLDRLGRRIASINDGAHVYRAYFDGLGNLAKTVDPLTNTVEDFCDDNGNLVKIKQTDKYPDSTTRVFETFNIYDALGRTVSTTNNAGDTHRFSYDSRDNLVSSSDAQNPTNASAQINGKTVNQAGNTRSYTHNGFDQVLQEMLDLRVGGNGSGAIDTSNTFNSDGKVIVQTAYDQNGRVTSRTDDNQKATSYFYDSRSRVTLQTFADTTHQDYVYDKASNLTQVTDARGNVVQMTYDDGDRLTLVNNQTQVSPTIGTRRLTFEYDGLGRRTKSRSSDYTTANDADWIVTRTYDGLSRIKTDAQGAVPTGTHTSTSTWAEESRRNVLYYSSGLEVSYGFDSLGRLSDVYPDGGILTTYTYAGHRLHDRTYQNGYSELFHPFNSHDDTSYYDDAGRPIKVDYKNTVGSLISSFEHAFDRMGNRKYERRVHNSNKGDNYVYDSLYRLTTFERMVPAANVGTPGQAGTAGETTKKDFKLDGVQNWRQLVTNDGTTTTTQDNSVNSTEAYSAFGADSPSYDLEGNLTSPDTNSGIVLKYDFMNRLRQVVQGSSVVSHLYDAEGRRVRTTITNVTGAPSWIEYTHDGWEVIEEWSGPTNPALMRRWVMGREIDEPLQMENVSFWPHAGTYEFHRSTLGNVVALTSTSGAVQERYTYDAYGTPQFETSGSAAKSVTESDYGNPYLFNGRRYDPWIYPMYEYRTRMYSPAMGRFVQRDSIGVWGDPGQFGNPFAYVGGKGINLKDPYGREAGKPYDSPREAASAALAEVYPVTADTGVEYGGYVYETGDGHYSYTTPSTSGKNETVDLPVAEYGGGLRTAPSLSGNLPGRSAKRKRVVGMYHTHPSPSAPGRSEVDRQIQLMDMITQWLAEEIPKGPHGDTEPPDRGTIRPGPKTGDEHPGHVIEYPVPGRKKDDSGSGKEIGTVSGHPDDQPYWAKQAKAWNVFCEEWGFDESIIPYDRPIGSQWW